MAIFRNLYKLFFCRRIYHNGKFSHWADRDENVYARTPYEAVQKAKPKGKIFTECTKLRIDADEERLMGFMTVKENVNRGGKEKKRK